MRTGLGLNNSIATAFNGKSLCCVNRFKIESFVLKLGLKTYSTAAPHVLGVARGVGVGGEGRREGCELGRGQRGICSKLSLKMGCVFK
jgi:hypothetical protein